MKYRLLGDDGMHRGDGLPGCADGSNCGWVCGTW